MKKSYREELIHRINRKKWWHVPPIDPRAYQKRGKFFSSTFREAEFWGRPNNTPDRVFVQNPLIGDEKTVWKALFGRVLKMPELGSPGVIEWIFKTDARVRKAALRKGYDALVILSPHQFARLRKGVLPRSMELNILKWDSSRLRAFPDSQERRRTLGS